MKLSELIAQCERMPEWHQFPDSTFSVLANPISTTEWTKIIKQATVREYDKKSRQNIERIHSGKLRSFQIQKTAHDFKGLTPKVIKESFKLNHQSLSKLDSNDPKYSEELQTADDDKISTLIALANESPEFWAFYQRFSVPDTGDIEEEEKAEEREKKIS